ncbi:hypothetical protein SERLADRAFT_339384, partial [Serpula lacrymans var. lacrymans S7.9]
MSSPQGVINERPFHQHTPSTARRHSKITIEYHKPSRESIQEYSDLLKDASLHAATAASAATYRDPYAPSKHLLARPAFRDNTPADPTPPGLGNSLHKQPPPTGKHSLPSTPHPTRVDHDPFAASSPSTISSPGPLPKQSGMTSPPARPSRANTATLNDIFPSQSALAARRLSTP